MLSLLIFALVVTPIVSLPLLMTQAMQSFCDTTNLQVVRGWCLNPNPCTWTGVECNVGETRVAQLELVGSDIVGTWPEEFNQKMSQLVALSVTYARLSGSLSDTFFDRQDGSLQSLVLRSTLLSFDIGDLSRDGRNMVLEVLFVEDTKLRGDIGTADPLQAPLLTAITLSYSSLRGTIPSGYFSGVPQLAILLLNNNGLTGPAPAELCTLPNLVHIDLTHNQFSLFDDCFADIDPVTNQKCDLRYNFKCNGQLADDDDDAFDGPATFNPSLDFSPCLIDNAVNAKLDACGICAGDGSTCTDCHGVYHGSSLPDVCGICDGDGVSCRDCDGVPFGTSQYDGCDVCDGGNACADCAGVPYGSAVYDLCGVCAGNASSCIDCNGILLGTSVLDVCDVCDGDGTTCDDCAGVAAGTAEYDSCGVCGGANDCLDCAGVAFGTRQYDICDVCDGDATTCGLGDLLESATFNGGMIAFIVVVLVLCFIGVCIAIYFVARTRRRL